MKPPKPSMHYLVDNMRDRCLYCGKESRSSKMHLKGYVCSKCKETHRRHT